MEIGHPSVVRAPLSKFDAIYMFARFHLLRLHKTELALHPGKESITSSPCPCHFDSLQRESCDVRD